MITGYKPVAIKVYSDLSSFDVKNTSLTAFVPTVDASTESPPFSGVKANGSEASERYQKTEGSGSVNTESRYPA